MNTTTNSSHFGFPYQVSGDGRTNGADSDQHVREMVELLLFTNTNERVNRPDFGSGARQLLFAGTSPEIASAVEFVVKGALQQWLGDLLQVESLDVESDDATLRIDIVYRLLATDQQRSMTLVREA